MDRIAFFFCEHYIYWSSVLLFVAVCVAILMFLALYIGRSGKIGVAQREIINILAAVESGKAVALLKHGANGAVALGKSCHLFGYHICHFLKIVNWL